MRKKIIIALAVLILGPLIINYLVYRPILLCLDKKLSEKARLLKEGMSKQEVLKIMGKPKEEKFIDLKQAREYGLPDNLIDKLGKPENKILKYSYYVPVLIYLSSQPVNTWVDVFFDDDGKVIYTDIDTWLPWYQRSLIIPDWLKPHDD